jgi:hypothetical protein
LARLAVNETTATTHESDPEFTEIVVYRLVSSTPWNISFSYHFPRFQSIAIATCLRLEASNTAIMESAALQDPGIDGNDVVEGVLAAVPVKVSCHEIKVQTSC